jgi:cytochrome c oxidase subunit IV
MWNFLLGFLFARTTGISRYVRMLLVLLAVGILVAGLIYAVVMQVLNERSHASHVPIRHTN